MCAALVKSCLAMPVSFSSRRLLAGAIDKYNARCEYLLLQDWAKPFQGFASRVEARAIGLHPVSTGTVIASPGFTKIPERDGGDV
jgi:hypothetical protein